MKKIILVCAVLGALLCQSSTRLADARPQVQLKQRPFIVCIDPGHPSETSDGADANGLSENRLNWQVAVLLKQRLDDLRIANVMTKNSLNQVVTNKRRAEIANGDNKYHQPCAIFIRLHCDEGAGHGFTWYYPDREGRKNGHSGPPKAVQSASYAAAYFLNMGMKPKLKGYLQSNPIKTDAATFVGGKQGGVLTGSIYSEVPTALIEMCYINNGRDARFISSPEGRERMAQALADGISSWRINYQKYWQPR